MRREKPLRFALVRTAGRRSSRLHRSGFGESRQRNLDYRRQKGRNQNAHSRQQARSPQHRILRGQGTSHRRQYVRRRGGAPRRGCNRLGRARTEGLPSHLDKGCRHRRSHRRRREKLLRQHRRLARSFRRYGHERQDERYLDAPRNARQGRHEMRTRRHNPLRPRRQMPARRAHHARSPRAARNAQPDALRGLQGGGDGI